MRVLKYCTAGLTLLLLMVNLKWATAQPDFEQRRADYIDTALVNFDKDAVVLQAFRNLPVDTNTLRNMINDVPNRSTADFVIVHLVRTLFLTNGEYDSMILPMLDTIPLWLTKNDTLRSYWSENHSSMWNSSNWLLHEKYGRPIDSTLETRLKHYLYLKVNYGFYEFFSTTYAPYCLSGLLNLADFAQDPYIKSMAAKAAQRLLREQLMPTNDQGAFFPAAGRNYRGSYENALSGNHYHLRYMLTGFGPAPNGASHAGAFLATTTVPMDTVVASWTEQLDTIYHIGHSLDTGKIINSVLTDFDRTLFQWSSGGYFHPIVAFETATLISEYNLWNHVDLGDYTQYKGLDPQLAPGLANVAISISPSSVISGQDVAIYKNKGVVLCSVQDFWKGKAGYQQYPLVATVGTAAVYNATGDIQSNWSNRSSTNGNSHFPYIEQKSNIALVMYRPETQNLAAFGRDDFDVGLSWPENKLDETAEEGNWLLGRQGNSYIGVYRHCIDSLNGNWACTVEEGQTWVYIVGDSSDYGSFADFQNILSQATVTDEWYMYLDPPDPQFVYHAKVVIDGDSIDYAWSRDVEINTGAPALNKTGSIRAYPNPASDKLWLDVAAYSNEQMQLSVTNLLGQQVYREKIKSPGATIPVNTSNWAKGLYIIAVETVNETHQLKVVVE